MLERNYSLHFKDLSCTIFDPSRCELMFIKMRNRSFPLEWKKKATHDVLKEDEDLKNISLKEACQALKCDSNELKTKVVEEKLVIFGHNKLEEKESKVSNAYVVIKVCLMPKAKNKAQSTIHQVLMILTNIDPQKMVFVCHGLHMNFENVRLQILTSLNIPNMEELIDCLFQVPLVEETPKYDSHVVLLPFK
ncbi:ATPase 11, plasma membrane-type, partial [Mucuna pruriens]